MFRDICFSLKILLHEFLYMFRDICFSLSTLADWEENTVEWTRLNCNPLPKASGNSFHGFPHYLDRNVTVLTVNKNRKLEIKKNKQTIQKNKCYALYLFKSNVYGSCRTVALWFYNWVSDHNATDPVVLTSCNLRRRFFCAIWGYISLLSGIVQANVFWSINLDISYYQRIFKETTNP
jgi:hypothetical protein